MTRISISTSVAGRLPRINPREAMTYRDWTIPKNVRYPIKAMCLMLTILQTPVSMTQRLTHFNPTIFPEPKSFIPERWIDPKERRRLEKYMQPFGKGSRACIGQQYVEVFPAIISITPPFENC